MDGAVPPSGCGRDGRSFSRPQRLRKPTPPTAIDKIIELRRQRFTGKYIAKVAGVSAATVSRVLKRAGLSRMRDLEPAEPVKRHDAGTAAR